MSAKNFKFVSPGVFIKEIDNSQLPRVAPPVGPVVIGRFRRGPAFLPTRVESLSELIRIFGEPIRGDEASDVWRGGIPTAPAYGAYAAAAWLKNGSPLTVIRVLGDQHQNPSNDTTGKAGWKVGGTPNEDQNPGGAYGLFLINSSSYALGATGSTTGVHVASWYFGEGGIILSGTVAGEPNAIVSGSGVLIESAGGSTYDFTAQVFTSGAVGLGTPSEVFKFNLDKNSKYYARKVFNTNPTRINSSLQSSNATTKSYFLGETFEKSAYDVISGDKCYGVILPLGDSAALRLGNNFKLAARSAQTGWFVAQDLRTTDGSATPANNVLSPAFDADNTNICPRLFKFHTLSAGQAEQRTFKISIENIKYSSRADIDPYGSFSVVIRSIFDNDTSPRIVERYDNCNLNPNSANYVAKVIGDAYYEWDNTKKRLAEYGSYPNNSSIVRIEMAQEIDLGQGSPELLPFGAQGPVKRQDFRVEFQSGSTQVGPNASATQSGYGLDFGAARFQSHTSSMFDQNMDLQYLNVRRNDDDSFKWGPGYGLQQSTASVSANSTHPVDKMITLTSSAGTVKTYVFCDIGTVGQGNGSLSSSAWAESGGAGVTGSLVRVNLVNTTGSNHIITQLTAAIDSANGHNGGVSGSIFDFVGYGGTIETNKFVHIINNALGGGQNFPIHTGTGSHAISSGSVLGYEGFLGGKGLDQSIDDAIVWGGTHLGSGSAGNLATGSGQGQWQATVKFPDVFLRSNADDGNLSDPTLAYFGYSTNSGSLDTTFEASNIDLLRPLPADFSQYDTGNYTKRMFMFSLDDISSSAGGAFSYSSGSRAAGSSVTARSGSYKDILDAGYNRFSVPLFGGFDGLDVTEAEPFNNSRALPDDATEKTYAMYFSVKKAIDMLADPEFLEMNLVTAPGITNESITQHLINVCEDRGDALAIIDPKGGYLPAAEDGSKDEKDRISTNHVKQVVDNMERRAMNSSYGCAYYPWIRINDDISGGTVWVPPSIAAIGAMSFSDKQKALWFAPAGFNRGGLSRGAAGFPVVNVRSKLTSAERDDLYEANINPIGSFPNEGIVIFGQKTLQVTPSALDRINVRRLMIFVKKQVSRIAANLLFEQNVESTWDRFKSQVDPFLSNIRSSFGLTDFKVVLDETTTTPELVDRNIMYAKIFLKPARAIEYIAIDFNITNTGASFDD
jgi:hypothetical protein